MPIACFGFTQQGRMLPQPCRRIASVERNGLVRRRAELTRSTTLTLLMKHDLPTAEITVCGDLNAYGAVPHTAK